MWVLDPTGERKDDNSKTLSPRPDGLNNRVVGILDNGVRAVTVPITLATLEEAVKRQFPESSIRRWKKPTHVQPAPQPMLEEIAGTCAAVIVAMCA